MSESSMIFSGGGCIYLYTVCSISVLVTIVRSRRRGKYYRIKLCQQPIFKRVTTPKVVAMLIQTLFPQQIQIDILRRLHGINRGPLQTVKRALARQGVAFIPGTFAGCAQQILLVAEQRQHGVVVILRSS